MAQCTKALYRAFLQASSMRYSGLALSGVSPSPLSHDSISRWLKSRCFRPHELWKLVASSIDKRQPCLLLADDTVLAKARGITAEVVVMDTWYSSLDNLKAIRSHGWIWVTCLRKNRRVNRGIHLESLDIPEDGLSVHLRG